MTASRGHGDSVASQSILEVDDLSVAYRRSGRRLPVLSNVSFDIAKGEALGLVGESGCGKSTVAFAIMCYLPSNAEVLGGSIRLNSEDLLQLTERDLRRRRGKHTAMVYQEPASALNPSLRIGEQIAEVYLSHTKLRRGEALEQARVMLEKVELPDAGRMMRRYPFQLSGGQQQRVVIAMAMAASPELLILDEPTTGLDATVESEVLDLIKQLHTDHATAMLFISHNLGVVTRMCERVAVVYAGRIVEQAAADEIFDRPRHPYTRGLVRCVPRFGASKRQQRLEPIPGSLPNAGSIAAGCDFAPRCELARPYCAEVDPDLFDIGAGRLSRCHFHEDVEPDAALAGSAFVEPAPESTRPNLLNVDDLRKRYGNVLACDDVSFTIREGEVLGLVGESGSGKSTLGSCIAGLVRSDGGTMRLNGADLPPSLDGRRGDVRRAIQMVFQDSDGTLNPRHTVKHVLSRAISRLLGRRSTYDLAAEVMLEPAHVEQRSNRLSGGQKQRVAIGRAFAGNPMLVVCDEPVSSLDVSVQAAILNLLADLQVHENTAYLFISHDLAVVHYIADQIAVMYLGQLYELGAAHDVIQTPNHPYTEALLSSIPTIGDEPARQRIRLLGPPASPAVPPSGCHFHTRCPRKLGEICEVEAPPWQSAGNDHQIRCHHTPEDLRRIQTNSPAEEVGHHE